MIRIHSRGGIGSRVIHDTGGDIVFALWHPLGPDLPTGEGVASCNRRPASEGTAVVVPSNIQTSTPIGPEAGQAPWSTWRDGEPAL